MVSYLKRKIEAGQIEIMLHGHDHLYFFENEGKILPATLKYLEIARKQKERLRFFGEFALGDVEALYKKIQQGKKYLEELLEIRISNFVPPSNQIGAAGIEALIRERLNLSGLIGRHYDRERTIRGVFTYMDRVWFALRHPDLIYPKIADYGSHKELAGYALTPVTNRDAYWAQLRFCLKHNLPFQIATHYWELQGELKDFFYEIVDSALAGGMKSRLLCEVL